jgi:DNA mismatch repair protein MutL
MPKINVLNTEIANLIAAGEVVERPSSVLKELIENSIDAGAKEITAEIKRGGVALIRVSDNGSGIEKEDLPISLQRHATSKIKNKDDLEAILTLGFRGEALAAISSVSEMTIISKTADAKIGTMLKAEGGVVVDLSEVGAADGTTVVVENLFYNVPARRKFLKKDSTEALNVLAMVQKVALSRPDISFQLLIDGEEKFKTPGDGKLENSIYAVFCKEFASKLIKIEGKTRGVYIHGFVGRSDNVKKNRNYENVFINNRYVKSITVTTALEKAFTSYISPDSFPACVLFLDIDPATVDVNVHPTKLEIKFSDEKEIFEAVYHSVKNALEDEIYRPEFPLTQPKGPFRPKEAFPQPPVFRADKSMNVPITPREERIDTRKCNVRRDEDTGLEYISFSSLVSAASGNANKGDYKSSFEMTPDESISILETCKKVNEEDDKSDKTIKIPDLNHCKDDKERLYTLLHYNDDAVIEKPYKIIGEMFNCYVIVEFSDYVWIVDKHAAHERVIFEELLANLRSGKETKLQSLVLPLTVLLSPEELGAAIDFMDDIKKAGFEYIVNGGGVDITAVPNAINILHAEELFIKMTSELSRGAGTAENTAEIRREKALYQVACKAAIKGGRIYDRAIIENIVEKLISLPDITVCPHGRPIAYKLTKIQLDKQFDRLK